jgi:chitin disaccharide deacetylase
MNRCSIRYAVTLMVAGALVGATERHASPAPAIRLIVQADDLGAAHGINVASIQAYTHGIVRPVNVIVPAPWTPEAVALLDQHPDLDAGVHLAITSEWSSIKWRPLTGAPSLVDARGYFLPMVWPNDRLPPKSSLQENAPVLAEIERELRAQIEFAKREIPQLTYTWNHMGFDSLAPEIRELTNKLTKEYGLVTPFDLGVQDIGHVYEGTDTGAVKATKLAARLEALGPWHVADGRSRSRGHCRDAGAWPSWLRERRGRSQRRFRGVDQQRGQGCHPSTRDRADQLPSTARRK